jgi:ubiquinone/menaquinone biosynthesis C-methylase UbiE
MNITADKIIGFDANAYSNRVDGSSPENTRDVVWNRVNANLQGTVLDVGSGAGGWINRLQQNTNITKIISTDIVDDGASKITGVEFHLVDVSNSQLPCKDNQLDWIFAIEVIEHLVSPRYFIREAHRCLKKGGRLLITTPSNESLRAKLSFISRGYFPAFCDQEYYLMVMLAPF